MKFKDKDSTCVNRNCIHDAYKETRAEAVGSLFRVVFRCARVEYPYGIIFTTITEGISHRHTLAYESDGARNKDYAKIVDTIAERER